MTVLSCRISSDMFDACDVEITGNDTVDEIKCDNTLAKCIIEIDIKKGYGWLANNYHPEPNTMLQAYATLSRYSDNVSIDGPLEEIPLSDEEGAVY